MSPLEEDRADCLITLARQRFDSNLLAAELNVLHGSASSDDPRIPDILPPKSHVRPEFLRWLLTDTEAVEFIDAKGVRIESATIAGQLDLSFCRISPMLVFSLCNFEDELLLLHSELRGLGIYASSASKGIVAHGAILHGPIFMESGFESSGPIDFHSARIEGSVQYAGTLLPTHGHPLSFEGASVQGSIFLANGFRSCGQVRLLGSKIDGDLNCSRASLNGIAGGGALSLDRAQVRGDVVFTSIEASATVSLSGAQIGGTLDCSGSTFTATDTALELSGATILGGVQLQDLKSSGELRVIGARIVNFLDCSNAVLTATDMALSLDRSNIQGGVFFRGLKSSGTVSMPSSQIELNLDCRGAMIAVLYCLNMKLQGELIWTSIQNPERAKLNLLRACVGTFRDDRNSWPSQDNLILDGLVYEQLSLHPPSSPEQLAVGHLSKELPPNANERIAWLKLQSLTYQAEPQPWMQLSKFFEAKGNKKAAKHVIFAWRQQQSKSYRPVCRFWSILVALLEENPGRVLWSLAILITLGTFIFWHAARVGAMAPTDREAYTAWATGKPFQRAYPRFQPLIYTIEDALPLVRLGQDDKWGPDPSFRLTTYRFLVIFRWLLIFLGWFQATVLAAALGSRFKA